jgi:uncharacterized protein YlaI
MKICKMFFRRCFIFRTTEDRSLRGNPFHFFLVVKANHPQKKKRQKTKKGHYSFLSTWYRRFHRQKFKKFSNRNFPVEILR